MSESEKHLSTNLATLMAVLWIRIRIGSGASWMRIQIRIRNMDPDPHMQIQDKMEAKDVRFKIQRLN